MRGATRHATGGNWRVGVYFFISLYEHIDYTLLMLPIGYYQYNCFQWNYMDKVTLW